MYTYTFRNDVTGETRRGVATSRNLAARSIGLNVPFRGELPDNWQAVACHSASGELIWSTQETGV